MYIINHLPSGNDCYSLRAIENDHRNIEIVDLPIENGGSFHRFFVCLPGRVSVR